MMGELLKVLMEKWAALYVRLSRDELPWIPLRCDEAIYGLRSTLTGMDKDAQVR